MNTIEQIKCMPMIVLEIGCNHMGDIELAKKMIYCAAKECGASAVKFQKRNNFDMVKLMENIEIFWSLQLTNTKN